jgi:hypothetical protein
MCKPRQLVVPMALLTLVLGAKVRKHTFRPACQVPSYPSPAPPIPPAIDRVCGLQGSGGTDANQNIAKNNFCASGQTQPVTLKDFEKLQQQVDGDTSIPFGDKGSGLRLQGPAVDRSPLQKLGEGKLVSLQGYVLLARQEGAESVNCEKKVPDDPAYHDIHIELVDSASELDECAGVVAEMIPHHRPATWTADNLIELTKSHAQVRVTGQLFFDSSHVPCQNGQGVGDNPKRVSLWEIHPIYKFEVCSGDCTGSGKWVPLDEVVSKKSAVTSPR